MNMPLTEYYLAAFAAQQGNETLPWLKLHRQQALAQLQNTGLPTRRHEHWKYNDVATIRDALFSFSDGKDDLIKHDEMDILGLGWENTHELVFINGHYSSEHSNIGELADNVYIGSLRAALSDKATLLENSFNQCVQGEQHVFAALNTICFNDGAFIYVPDHVQIELPVVVHFVSSNSQEKLLTAPRNLIVMGKNTQLSIVENFYGGADGFTNPITEVEIDTGATLEYCKVHQKNSQGIHIGGTHFRQQQDSHVESHSITIGGSVVRNDVSTELLGEGAKVFLNGLYMGKDTQQVDNHIMVHHVKPGTQSEVHYRGVLDDSARGVFDGKVVVNQGAYKTQAAQHNANLLLSERAEANTKPVLEIYADDVQCSHGATVGQLDEDMLFYLRSRGIDQETARDLLIFAFIGSTTNRIRSEPIRERLQHDICAYLPAVDLIEAGQIEKEL